MHDFRVRVAKMAALAFLPEGDVEMAWGSLKTEFEPDEQPLALYFEKTWIGEAYVRRRGHKEAMYVGRLICFAKCSGAACQSKCCRSVLGMKA